MPGSNFKEPKTVGEYDSIVSAVPSGQAVFIDMTATWCPPCKMIGPVFEKLSTQTPHATFLKVDVDKLQPVAQRFAVRAMPTFIVLKNGQKVGEMVGANPSGLSALIQKHAGSAPASGFASGSGGNKLGGAPAGSAPGDAGIESLIPQIYTSHVTCLNEDAKHGIKTIIGPDAGPKGSSYLESESDPELLLYIPFNQPVKIKYLSLFSGISPTQGPKTVKLFINQPQFDFSDADSHEATQELTLSEKEIKGERVELRFVRFQSVNSLHILVKNNQGDEETTRIDSIDIFGSAVHATSKDKIQSMQHDH